MERCLLLVSTLCVLISGLDFRQESLRADASTAAPLHLNGEYFGPLEVSRNGFLYKQVGAGSGCVDSSGAQHSRLRSTYARDLGDCMDSCNAFALSTCHGIGFQDSVGCLLFLEAGAGSGDAPGLDRQAWTLANGTGTGPVAASQMGLDGRGGACYRRQLDASCYLPGRVRKIVWEGCRCLTHWALELDDGLGESPSQFIPSRNWRNCAGEAHLDRDEYILGMTQYGGGYCNFYGGWGRSFDFLTNKRTVNVKAPGKPQLRVASEVARRAVTVSSTKEGGKFFLFHSSEWISIFGVPPGSSPVKTRVKQLRHNELLWQGEVVVWSNANGPHGRRSHEGEPLQWQLGDLVVPASGPDAGAVDFLLARMPATSTRKSELVFRVVKMETVALQIKEISLFHASGASAAALGGDVVMYSQQNVYGLNEASTYTADGYIDYEDVDVAGPGCTSGGKLSYGGLHDGDETKSACNYRKVEKSIGADILSIQTAGRVRYVRVCTAFDAWAEFDIFKDETSVVETKASLLGASQAGKLRCWLYTLSVATEKPASFMSKAGKGGCDDSVEGNLLLGHSGFSSEEKVQDKCRELRCGYYIWSNDPASSHHSAWFCMTNYFGQVSNAHEHPDWRVGFPIGNYAYGHAGNEECPAASSVLSLSECKVFALMDGAKNGQGKRCSSGSEGPSSSFTDACAGKLRQAEFCNSRPKGCWMEDRGEDGLCVFYNDGPGTGAAGAVPVCEKEDLAIQFRVDNLASSPGQLRFKQGGSWANRAVSTMVIHNSSKYCGFAFTVAPMDDASPPGFAMGLSSRPDEEKEEWFKTWDFSVVQARQDQRLYILETNQLAGTAGQFGVLRSGDTVALAVSSSGRLQYWVNGELKHVSDKQPRYPLYVVGNFMAAGARVKDIRWWEGKKDVVLHLEEKVQFSLRLQPGKQLVGPFVGPVAGLYPEGRVTQVGLADVCAPEPSAPGRGLEIDEMPRARAVVTSTCGGTGGGAACKFPFEFHGKTYGNCTKEGHDQPWCFTLGGDAKWGNCDCPSSMLAVGAVTSASETTGKTSTGAKSFEYALMAAATRSADAGYGSCWDIGEIQFFSDRMCRNQITVNSRSISVSTYEDGLESYEYKEMSKDTLCRAGVDGLWYLGGRRAARGGIYDSLDACKDLCTAERTCAFFGYRATDGRCEFFSAFGDCENKMGGAPGFVMYKKLKPLQTAASHEVSCAKMALLPVKKGSMEARCHSGNRLGDGFEYIFNTGAGTAAAACGEASICECCMRQKKAEDGPWPVASRSNTRCGVNDMAAKVIVSQRRECQTKAINVGHAYFSFFDAEGQNVCLTSATCTTLVEDAHGWRVYGRHPAGRKELFGRGSAALGVAQGGSLWTEIPEKSLAISKLVDGLDVTPLRVWGRQAVWVRAEVPGEVGCIKVFQSAAELSGCRPSALVEVKHRAGPGAAWVRLATAVWPTSPSWVRIATGNSHCVGTQSRELPGGFSAPSQVPALAPRSIGEIFSGATAGEWGPSAQGKRFVAVTTYPKKDGGQGLHVLFGSRYPQTAPAVNLPPSDCQFGGAFGTGSMPLLEARNKRPVSWPGATWKIYEGPMTVSIDFGHSDENVKCVDPDEEAACEAEAGNHRGDHFPDRFTIFGMDGQVCAKRGDEPNAPWTPELRLIISCKSKAEASTSPLADVGFFLGSPGTSLKCTTSDDPVFCTAETGDDRYDALPSKYLTYSTAGSEVCAVATQSAAPAQLAATCMTPGLAAVKDVRSAVVIGPGVDDLNRKCITPPMPVTCDREAATHRSDPFSHRFDVVPFPGGQLCAVLTHPAPTPAKRIGPLLLAEGSQGSGKTVAGNRWLQGQKPFSGIRGSQEMCGAGDEAGTYLIRVFIEQGSRHQVGVASRACCELSTQSGNGTQPHKSFAALASIRHGWEAERGAATPAQEPGPDWFDTWDGPQAVTMVVSCLKRSFTLGLDGGDDFLGEMSWPDSWIGVYSFIGGIDGDHIYRVEWSAAASESSFRCTELPAEEGSDAKRCLRGNELGDGREYAFNLGRETPDALCAGNCACCARKAATALGPGLSVRALDSFDFFANGYWANFRDGFSRIGLEYYLPVDAPGCESCARECLNYPDDACVAFSTDGGDCTNAANCMVYTELGTPSSHEITRAFKRKPASAATTAGPTTVTTVTTTKAWDFELAISCSPRRGKVAFYSVGAGTCQDASGREATAATRPLGPAAPGACEAYCEEMNECLGYVDDSETCTLYLSNALDLPDGWSLEAGADDVIDVLQGSGGPGDAHCMKKGLPYCGWMPKPSTGTALNCSLESAEGDGCSHSACRDVLACQAACDRCGGCVGFAYQALSTSGVRCFMKSSWNDTGRDFVSVAPNAHSWQSYVNARHGACSATQRTVHYCGWTKQIGRSAVPLNCGLQSPGGDGCSTEACPDLSSCKARCSACHGCVGFDIMEQGNSGYRCWMRSAWDHDSDYQSSNPDNSSWHPYVNERDALCNQDPKTQWMRGQVLKHVAPLYGQKEVGDERASTCLRSELDLQQLPRGAYTIYAELKLNDAAGGQVISWGANGDEGQATSPCLKARYWGLAATESSVNGYYEPFYLDFFESPDGTGEALPDDEVYVQGLISPGVKITQRSRGRHFLQYKPNQQNWGMSWTEHKVPLIYRDLGSEKVIRSARHAARPNHVPQEALIVASNDGIVWYARFRATGDSARELINEPVQCKDPEFVPESQEGSGEEVLPMRKHTLWIGGGSVRSIWGRNTFEATVNKSLADGKWHSAMSTFDGVTQKIWVDHALVATKVAKNFPSVLQTSNFCVGSRADGKEAFPGELRNLQIFTEAKTPGSVQADMNMALVGTPSMSSTLSAGTQGALNDGSLGSRAISVGERNPWAQVDLGSSMPIGRIQLENVDVDKCASRLFVGTECSWDYDIGNYSAADQGASIGISPTPCKGDVCGGIICTRVTGSNRDGTGHTYAGDCQGRHGRYVYVQLPGPSRVLDLREFRVFKAASAANLGETVLCADGSSSCAGDVCCPGFEATGFKSYPCPSAHDTFMACQIKTKVANALANVSRQASDDLLEENLTLNATTAAAPEGQRVFVPMDGGVGRSCRGAHREDWQGSYVVKHRRRSLEMCKLICRSHPLCQGIEYSDDCDMWVRAEGIGASVAYEGPARFSTCLRLVPQDLAPKTRFTSQLGSKCRGKPYTMNQTAGCNGWKGLTIEGCKEKCRMNSIAEKCPAKLCVAAVFFTNSSFCHLHDDCEETVADRNALLLHREVTALQVWPGLVAKGEEVNPNPGMFDFGAGPQSFSILAGLSKVKEKKIQGGAQGPILSKLLLGQGKNRWHNASGWEFGVIYDKKCRCRLLRFIFRTASKHTFFGYSKTPLTGAEVEVAMSFNAQDFTIAMWVNGKEEEVAQRPKWYRSRFAGEFSSRAKLTIGRRSGASEHFDGQLFNTALYRGVLEGKDFAGVEVTGLNHQFVGVGKTLSDDWIQVQNSLLQRSEAQKVLPSQDNSTEAEQVGNWSEAVPCKGCSRYTQHRVGGVCQYDKPETECAICMPPEEGVFNCQCGRRFPHTCAPCGKEDLCSSLANEPPLELGQATLHGISFNMECRSSGTVQLQAQVIAPYSGSDVFYLSIGSCPSWRWYLHSGWGTNCGEDERCTYQDEPRWTTESAPCRLREGKHFVTFRPSHPGDLKLTRLRLTSGSDFCSFEPLPPTTTTTTTTSTVTSTTTTTKPMMRHRCFYRYYALHVLETNDDQATTWQLPEVELRQNGKALLPPKSRGAAWPATVLDDDDNKASYYKRREEAAITVNTTATGADTSLVEAGREGGQSRQLAAKLLLDLGEQNFLTEYAVVSGPGPASKQPKKWILKGSNDASAPMDEWDELSKRDSDEPAFPPGELGRRKPLLLPVDCPSAAG